MHVQYTKYAIYQHAMANDTMRFKKEIILGTIKAITVYGTDLINILARAWLTTSRIKCKLHLLSNMQFLQAPT